MLSNNSQQVSLDTEIRKIKPIHIWNLARLLNISDNWKKLMSSICIENSEQLKFGTDDLNLIEEASRHQKMSCAEIFFNEWGTMGRKRPTLRTLLELLKKAELYRAADYVSIHILNLKETERPNEGPAARIEIPILDPKNEADPAENSILGNVLEENSVINKDENLQTPEEKREAVVAPIPAFLSGLNSSNFNETFVGERSEIIEMESILSDTSQPIKSQEINCTGNGEACNIPVFLQNRSFSNFSARISNDENSDDSENKVRLPRFLSGVTLSTSHDPIVSGSDESLSKNTVENTPSQNTCKVEIHEPSTSRENDRIAQLPACLEGMNLSSFSVDIESEESSISGLNSDSADG